MGRKPLLVNGLDNRFKLTTIRYKQGAKNGRRNNRKLANGRFGVFGTRANGGTKYNKRGFELFLQFFAGLNRIGADNPERSAVGFVCGNVRLLRPRLGDLRHRFGQQMIFGNGVNQRHRHIVLTQDFG